jgi:cysteine desulfurase
VIQPVAEVSAVARAFGALVHCDAVQAVGRIAVDFAALGVDMMTLSAHKLGGPLGAGALVIAERIRLESRITGGGQERGRRAGSENVSGIAGLGAVAEVASAEVGGCAHNPWGRISALRDRLEGAIGGCRPGARIFGVGVARLPNTSCFALAGLAAETQVMALDLAGIAVSAGAACSSGKVAASHVLDAMGVDPSEAASAIRVSLGPGNDEGDVSRFVEAWAALSDKCAPRGKRRLNRDGTEYDGR